MAQAVIPPMIPNIGNLEEAIAGSSEVIFTATDRKIIQERAGEIDRSRRFREIFKEDNLLPEVENEETTVNEEKNIPEVQSRLKTHNQMLRHSPLYSPHERVEISEGPEKFEKQTEEIPMEALSESVSLSKSETKPATIIKIKQETAAIIKELNLDPVEITSKFSLDEKELHELVYKIKNLHLQRILASSKEDFENLSQKIEENTLNRCKKEARKWLKERLDKLTLNAAQYKLNLTRSLQSFEYHPEREKDIHWIEKIANHLASSEIK